MAGRRNKEESVGLQLLLEERNEGTRKEESGGRPEGES